MIKKIMNLPSAIKSLTIKDVKGFFKHIWYTFRHTPISRKLVYLFVIALVAFTALPLVYLVSSAFKPLDELFLFPPRFFVRNPTTKNFSELLLAMDSSVIPFSRYIANSIIISIATVAGTVVVCTMGAFALTKIRLPKGNIIFSIIIATLMFSPPVTQITNYLVVQFLHMYDNPLALIVPKIAGSYYLFLLKQSFGEIPDALIEAAKIDGCSYWTIYARIIMPTTRPAWATAIVFSFVASWNDFTGPMVYIKTSVLKTLPLALQSLQGGAGQVARTGAFAAASLITTLPTILVFVAMQSKVIDTMTHSGIK